MVGIIRFNWRPHLLKWNIYVVRKNKHLEQAAEGLQNMSGVSLIVLVFIN